MPWSLCSRVRPSFGAPPSSSILPHAALPFISLHLFTGLALGVADVCLPKFGRQGNLATPATLAPSLAVTSNGSTAAGFGGIGEDAELGANAKSASTMPSPFAVSIVGAVDVHAEAEDKRISRTPTAALFAEGRSRIGVGAEPAATTITATSILTALRHREPIDVVAKLDGTRRSATPMGQPSSLAIISARGIKAASSSLYFSCSLVLLPSPPWEDAQAWAVQQSMTVILGRAGSLGRIAHGTWGMRGDDRAVVYSSRGVAWAATDPPARAAWTLAAFPTVDVRHVPT